MTVDRPASLDDPPPSLPPHYQGLPLLRGSPPPFSNDSVLSPSRHPPLEVLPPTDSVQSAALKRQVHTFRTRARARLAPPPCRAPSGQHAGSPRTHPRAQARPWFRCHLISFDTSSAVRFRSPSWPTPDALTGTPFPQRSAPRHLTDAPCGGLRPTPAWPATEGLPPSLVQHCSRMVSVYIGALLHIRVALPAENAIRPGQGGCGLWGASRRSGPMNWANSMP